MKYLTLLYYILMLEVVITHMKTNVIKGRAVYYYRGSQYIDIPDNMYIKKMIYKEEDNATYCYLKKRGFLVELLCTAIMIGCVMFNNVIYDNATQVLHYNSIVTYYDGKLYVNLKSEEGNIHSLDYKISTGETVIREGTLLPNNSLIYVEVENPSDYYELVITYKSGFLPITKSYKLTVDNKDILEEN